MFDDANVVSAIDLSEILEAIKKCKHGKASGPEEFGNRFYKDFSGELAPVLAELYTRWLQCGVTPCSFGGANIQCLKKQQHLLDRLTTGQSLYSTATTKFLQKTVYPATSDAVISGLNCTNWISTRSQYSNCTRNLCRVKDRGED